MLYSCVLLDRHDRLAPPNPPGAIRLIITLPSQQNSSANPLGSPCTLTKSFNCNTYQNKLHNPFKCNTYKKQGEGEGATQTLEFRLSFCIPLFSITCESQFSQPLC